MGGDQKWRFRHPQVSWQLTTIEEWQYIITLLNNSDEQQDDNDYVYL